MKIAGIIAEYNPFHAGHEYHIQKTREETGCDYVVCVMAGAFTQRGEAAIMDKFARAECALLCGADAVFELPAVYAVRPAQWFARGGVSILNALGADVLSFGCETDDMALLNRVAEASLCEPEAFKARLREGLKRGESFARARGAALSETAGVENAFLDQPNVALALEYLKEMKRISSRMTPFAVKRSAPYRAEPENADGEWASASSVRRAMLTGRMGEALSHLPEGARSVTAREAERGFSASGALDSLILWTLRSMKTEDAERLPDGGEGLALRLLSAAKECADVETLISRVKCKRYTRARIGRLIAGALLGLPEVPEGEPYLRLLGFKRLSAALLKELDARSGGRIVSDSARLEGNADFEIEKRATDLWGLTTASDVYRAAGRERTQKFIMTDGTAFRRG